MMLSSPYIHLVSQKENFHAIFALRVPFIPSFLTSDFTRSLVAGGKSRIDIVINRQIRFINDLRRIDRELLLDNISIELRLIAKGVEIQKNNNVSVKGYPHIDIIFLGKVKHKECETAKNWCTDLYHKFITHYPLEDPFNFPIEVLDTEEKFNRAYKPIDKISDKSNSISNPILEICKYEDIHPFIRENMDPSNHSNTNSVGYYLHTFMPTFDASAFGRFMEALVQQKQICIVSVCLRPTTLKKKERLFLIHQLVEYNKVVNELKDDYAILRCKEHYRKMLESASFTIDGDRNLFQIKIQVLGDKYPPHNVVEALGSELLGNSYTSPRFWSKHITCNEDQHRKALFNFKLLEFEPWVPLLTHREGTQRLSQLVIPVEAAGAFRLPIPPESGYLPGVGVRDEPFVFPTRTTFGFFESISMGEIYHHGQPTGESFCIPVKDFAKHGLIAGATGSGKTNTCLHLLSQLYSDHNVPFLVMYPIDKPDYRLLMADDKVRDDLLIYTVGDETTAPLRFNPFYVAENILLKTHISLLMRCFSAAFSMWDPLPAVYRAAIRDVYEVRGWDINQDKGKSRYERDLETPSMRDFKVSLKNVTEKLTKGFDPEAKARIQQSAEIRLEDLLLNAGTIFCEGQPEVISNILKHPTVIELGRVGSSQDSSLMMGFLTVLIIEELQSNYKKLTPQDPKKALRHVLLIEEAHRLMSAGQSSSEDLANPQAKGGEDFANILAEVRGFGQGILIAEQIPTQLVNGALGNTNLKVMHRLEDHDSFKLFTEILNLNERQKDYVRSLGQGQVIVRGNDSRPISIKVGNYVDRFPNHIDSDEAVREFMTKKGFLPISDQPIVSKSYPSSREVSHLNLLSESDRRFTNTIKKYIANEEWEKAKNTIQAWTEDKKNVSFKENLKNIGYIFLCNELASIMCYDSSVVEKLISYLIQVESSNENI